MSGAPTVGIVHFPSSGHIRPIQPLVAALESEGLRVVQWVPADWQDAGELAGAELRSFPDLSGLRWPHKPSPLRILAFLADTAERLAPWMTKELADAGVDAVVRDSFAGYGHYAARANGLNQFVIPAAMAFHRGIWPRAHGLSARGLRGDIGDALALRASSRRLRRRYGEPLGDPLRVFCGRFGSPTFVMTVPSLQTEPERLHGEEIHYVGALRALGPDGASEEPALAGLAEGEQVVYVSWGTVFEQKPEAFLAAARALAAPGRRVILSIGRVDAALLGALPEGVIAQSHVDQIAVLRRADLFVTHGGFNSMQEGLAAGVPLLLFPQMFEQAVNADQVAALGAGVRLRSFSERALAGAARSMLADPSYRLEAERLALELKAGNRGDAAVQLVARAARQKAGADRQAV
ncbi:MAG TPA: glycosyltransferase [Solirubrobacteraceae bacterium]|jgi:MGT family glycosyltransferase|nr:glycosyltransferase [Solirubrobacteraceae bacterium]